MASRYQVQERFAAWGRSGQARLSKATAVVVGLGALGGTAASLLARAGVGRLRLVDPDRPSLDNLHRQLLFSEADVAAGLNKAEAAARALQAANQEVDLEPMAQELIPANAKKLLAGADVVLDGLDNPAGRYVINQACLDLGIPWVHAGVAGSGGQLLVVRPGLGPCLQCWAPPQPPANPLRSVANQGVIGPLPSCLASLQAAEALKLLLGAEQALLRGLLIVELWPPRFRELSMDQALRKDCPACGGRFAASP